MKLVSFETIFVAQADGHYRATRKMIQAHVLSRMSTYYNSH